MIKKQHCFEECTFIIFGITGDLSKRKLIPAIYKLIEDHRLCKFSLVGVASSDTSVEQIMAKAKQFIPKAQDDILTTLTKAFSYYQMDFHNKEKYADLKDILTAIEKKHGLPGNRIFYFATMPEHFMIITKNLVESHIIKQHPHTRQISPWSRVVYEKPFGHNLRSSRIINRYIAQIFDESQVFRIDHYLGKELVGNIAMTRFTNRVLEPLWNNKNIDSIEIVIKETIGIEERGAYFDKYGIIKDMIQSHLLQLLALTTMEAPEELTATYLRDAKARVLKRVKVTDVTIGQYEDYHKEKNVKKNSLTETFAALKVTINNKRWKGVPFYLITGKFLDTKESYIKIKFKQAECLLQECPSEPNYLRINIQPDEGIYLDLNVKKPGSTTSVMPVTMEFSHSCLFGPNTPEAYEVLLTDVIKGDQSAFVRNDEIEASWKIVDSIKKYKKNLIIYKKGSKGPTVKK